MDRVPGTPLSAATGFPREAIDGSIPARFREMVRQSGDHPALVWMDAPVTYRELDALAGAAARALRAVAGEGAGRVALYLPQGTDLVAAMLGVLEAGHAYVPLSPAMPGDGARERVEAVEACALVTCAALAEGAAEVAGGRPVVVLDDARSPAPPDRPSLPVAADALAYVYFTSGTTGRPKGVMDTHRNVLHNVMRYSRALGFTSGDRMTVVQASTFSGVVSSVFGALLNGAALLPYDLGRDGAGPPLARWIERTRPTVFHSVPSIFRSVCTGAYRFPSVRVVRLEGDVAAPRDVALFRRHFRSDAVLVNGLGTTETGLCAQFFVHPETPVPARVVPVGFAVTDMEVAVMDEHGAPAPAGAIGEIVVRSHYLATGYWRDPERTAAAFIAPDAGGRRAYRTGDAGRIDPEGRLEHLGRRDQQLRMHGEWVDVTAIERACEAAPQVAEAAVHAERDEEGEMSIAAYLVPNPGALPTWSAVHDHLRGVLPPLAVPARLWLVDALPLTPEGKFDRSGLGRVAARRLERDEPIVAPRTDTERMVAALWAEVIDVPRIGIHDRFDDMGGTSLGAARVLAAIERNAGVTLSLRDFMEARTIAGIAARLDADARASAFGTLIRLQPYGTHRPLFCVHDLESDAFLFAGLSRRLGDDRPVYALRYPPGGALTDVPATMSALAARFLRDVRTVCPDGPFDLAGFCYGGVVAQAMARQLADAGEWCGRLVLFNVSPFDFPNLVSADARARFHTDWAARARYLLAKPNRVSWVSRRLVRTVRDRLAAVTDRGRLKGAPGPGPADDEAVRARLLDAFRRHVARPCGGPVLLALAEETLPLYTEDPAAAWRPLSEPAPEVITLPHDGYAMLVEPDVKVLAARVGAWLDAAPDTGRSAS